MESVSSSRFSYILLPELPTEASLALNSALTDLRGEKLRKGEGESCRGRITLRRQTRRSTSPSNSLRALSGYRCSRVAEITQNYFIDDALSFGNLEATQKYLYPLPLRQISPLPAKSTSPFRLHPEWIEKSQTRFRLQPYSGRVVIFTGRSWTYMDVLKQKKAALSCPLRL